MKALRAWLRYWFTPQPQTCKHHFVYTARGDLICVHCGARP